MGRWSLREIFFWNLYFMWNSKRVISIFCVVLWLFKWVAIVWSVGEVLYIDSAGCLLILTSLISCLRWLPLLVSGFVPPCICSHEGYDINVGQSMCRCALSGTLTILWWIVWFMFYLHLRLGRHHTLKSLCLSRYFLFFTFRKLSFSYLL